MQDTSNLPKEVYWNIYIQLILALTAFGCQAFLFGIGFLSYPSTETFARIYFDAITDNNLESAVRLAKDGGCREWVRRLAKDDIERFGSVETQNVKIEVKGNQGSDDEIQYAVITFEYRLKDQLVWQSGKVDIMTDYDPPGFRYLCAGG